MYTVDALGNLRSFCLKDMMSDTKSTFFHKGRSKRRSVMGKFLSSYQLMLYLKGFRHEERMMTDASQSPTTIAALCA